MTDTPMNQAMNPTESSNANTNGMLRLFVYGTLKRGFWNHDRFCRGVLTVEDAVVRGRLYEMHSGIPVLQVPDEDILANGTADTLADVATQARLSEQLASYPEATLKNATAGDWGSVYGELLTFDDPETRLPAIDRLEGFHPGGPSLYRRVLVLVGVSEAVFPAWLYVGEANPRTGSSIISSGVWRRPHQVEQSCFAQAKKEFDFRKPDVIKLKKGNCSAEPEKRLGYRPSPV